MFANLKFGCVWLAVACVALSFVPEPASAITADVARKCRTLTAIQFPPRAPGNPAAGSAKGSGRAQYEYFDKCVANGGKVDNSIAPK
ncbi:hypothetical protein [Bradyrhizobium sp. LTSPM299]|jgi:hypothetical protein|uniref:hypothetical protein n=1 Tax=Bradyrhizobium sp. LTSPM299 TaxID=1619233 RepID=UPI000AC074EE|nr:hypothetical protein [Bradyrhizobium sp. LTSPM299]